MPLSKWLSKLGFDFTDLRLYFLSLAFFDVLINILNHRIIILNAVFYSILHLKLIYFKYTKLLLFKYMMNVSKEMTLKYI